jgi:signal transduction histidine kinase
MSTLLFIRSYLLIVFLILLVGLGLDKVLSLYTTQESVPTEKMLLKGSFLYIEKQLKENLNNQAAIQSELGFPITLYQLSDFSSQEQFISLLAAEETVVTVDEDGGAIYYQQPKNTDTIIAIGPLSHQKEPLVSEAMIIALYYFLVAGALFVWLWPFSKDLHTLRKAATSFGEEGFSTRVNLRKNSSITPVANAFDLMAQHIQELVVSHQDLTNAVSHELKTPLARFKFSLEIIAALDNPEKRDKYIQSMKGDVQELDELIDEMLRYAKLTTDNLQLHLEKVDAEQWISDIIAHYQQDNIQFIFKASTKTGKKIVIDIHQMSRAINNLIRNGLRYTENRLQVNVKIMVNKITIHIDDDGQGIPTEHLDHVFHPFTRLDTSRDKQSGGYGLGLAITQKIIQQHHGSIVANHSVLGGASFQISWKPLDINSTA